jgi:hypothetical protein
MFLFSHYSKRMLVSGCGLTDRMKRMHTKIGTRVNP